MLIHELAEQTGLSVHAIRYYEKQGLLDETLTYRSDNNYRHYLPEAVNHLLLIKQGQSAGFTLAEMRSLIRLWNTGELTGEEKRTIVLQKIAEVEERIAQLQQMRAYLLYKLPLVDAEPADALVGQDLAYFTSASDTKTGK